MQQPIFRLLFNFIVEYYFLNQTGVSENFRGKSAIKIEKKKFLNFFKRFISVHFPPQTERFTKFELDKKKKKKKIASSQMSVVKKKKKVKTKLNGR